MNTELESHYDVVVIGGGAAGLNGAMMLGRSLRSVAVIDAGHPRNAPAEAVHGLFGHDGTPPAELYAKGREEVTRYGGHLIDGEVVTAKKEGDRFAVALADGRTTSSRRLLLTTGLVDELVDIPGLAERWGKDVVHCPYCHGYEVRGQQIGLIATTEMSLHQAMLFSQLTNDLTYFSHLSPLTEEGVARLRALDVRVVEGEVTEVEHTEAGIEAIRLVDGTRVPVSAVALGTKMHARAGFVDELGLEVVDHPSGMGSHIAVDAQGRTSVPGVFAAGNVTDIAAQVGAAAAAGAMAGGMINALLIGEDMEAALLSQRR